MHARKKGSSSSTRPISKELPDWVEMKTEEIEELILDLHKQGRSTSMIGMILRDEYGIPSTKLVNKIKVTKILKKNGIVLEYPEDLINLMTKALNIHKHMKINPKDLHNKRQLNNAEAKIRRLVRYYKKKGTLPADWKYTPDRARLLVG